MKTNLLLVALFVVGFASAQQVNNVQGQISTQKAAPDKANLVKRNKTAGITFIKDKIYQDDREIGGVQMAQGTEKGRIVRTFTIFFTDGSKIAEAKSYGNKSHEWHIITLRDKHAYVMAASSDNVAIDVIKYLIGKDYI